MEAIAVNVRDPNEIERTITDFRGEVSQILRNGCSDGKFREPAVNQKIKETECHS